MITTHEPTLFKPIADVDPRTQADPQLLVQACRNAYPVTARTGRRSDTTGVAIGAGVAVLLGGATLLMLSLHRSQAPAAPLATPIPVPLPTPPSRITAIGVAPLPPPPLARRSVSIAAIEAAAAPAMVFDGSATPAASGSLVATAPVATTSARETSAPALASNDENAQFAARVGGSTDVAAARQPADPASTVMQGTLIPAVLETAIDTDLPGYVRAVVSRDVRAFDGFHVVIPRSSRLIGQYKSGLAAGQTRAYIIWTRLIRPDGVSVALASPAVDFSGASGLTGAVDGHFLKRFGSAALLTVIGGLSAIGSNTVVLSGSQNAGAVAAQGDGQIPPTIKVLQGQPIRVFTARDLDFSTISKAG